MDTVTHDLHHYHLARLLHLVPQLYRVYSENCFLLPLFFACVSSQTKKHAKLILLCLQRCFGSNYASNLAFYIFSFLSFPEFAAPPICADSRRQQLLALQLGAKTKRLREEADGGRSAVQLTSRLPDATGEPVDGGGSANVVEKEKVGEEGAERPGLATHLQTEAEGEKQPTAADMLFYVRPPPAVSTTAAAAAKTSAQTTPQLFVRMLSEYPLNEEIMNTFFGRYGQVSCTVLRQQLLSVDDNTDGAGYLQDFIVTVDSTHNALQAVCHAYYRELVFVALYDPAYNIYTLDDIDRMINDVAVKFIEERPSRRGTVAEKREGEEDGDGGAAGSPVHTFIPDVIVDGLPYWLTVDQLRASFSEYGRIVDLRISIDERSGAFTGAALLRMATVEEALAASEGLNGMLLKGHTLVSGVLDDRLNIVSLRHGAIICSADEVVPEHCDLTENHRRWV